MFTRFTSFLIMAAVALVWFTTNGAVLADSVTTDTSVSKAVSQEPSQVERLLGELQSNDEVVRLRAAKELGKLGAAASGALPALQRIAEMDADEDVRRVAAASVTRIQSAMAAPTPTDATGRPVTNEELVAMLRNMGYEVKVITPSADGSVPSYNFQVRRDTWTVPLSVSLSRSGQYAYVAASIGLLRDDAASMGAELLSLLGENWRISPAYFAYAKQYNSLWIQEPLENRELTPQRLRVTIDRVVGDAIATAPTTKKLVKSATAPTTVPVGPGSVAGSTWVGNETLPGMGTLTFRFDADGRCTMIDAAGTTAGIPWTQTGNQVTVTLGNCVYEGNVQGQTLSGTARWTKDRTGTWTFHLTRQGGSPTTPPPTVAPGSVAGSTWVGNETLPGMGTLTFRFDADGRCTMIDAAGTTAGIPWTQTGNQITVTLSNCVYEGNVQGQTLSGTARWTKDRTGTWTFHLTRQASNLSFDAPALPFKPTPPAIASDRARPE